MVTDRKWLNDSDGHFDSNTPQSGDAIASKNGPDKQDATIWWFNPILVGLLWFRAKTMPQIKGKR